jgi:type IV pilus assembly protein PilO
MNKWLDELKQLDPKNPGGWAWPFKLGAFILIFIGILTIAFFFVFQGQQDDISKEEKKEADLKTAFLEKKKLAVNLEAYQQQRQEIEQSFGELLKKLPTKSEIDALIIDINQAGLGRGLQFDLFKPTPNENLTEFYAERPVNLKVNGNYHDLGAFASDISKLPRIVLLHDLKIDLGVGGALTMEAVAKTYRYLDPEESAAQRKVQKVNQKGPGGKAGAK